MQGLIAIAIEAATTRPNRDELKVHMQHALDCGAIPDEIVQVLQLADVSGQSRMDAGLEILEKEMEKMRNETDESGAPTFEYER